MRPHLDTWESFKGDYEYHFKGALDFKDKVNREGASAFMAGNPSFPASVKNAQALFDWCEKQNIPMTRANLETAWRELRSEGKIEEATPRQKAIGKLVRKEIEIRPVAAAQVAEPTPQERKTLDATRDDSTLTDHTRKKRFAELKKAAVASRISHRRTAF